MSEHVGSSAQPEVSDAEVARLKAERDELAAEVEELKDRGRVGQPHGLEHRPVRCDGVAACRGSGGSGIHRPQGDRSGLPDPGRAGQARRRPAREPHDPRRPHDAAVQGFVEEQVLKVVQSDAFATFWEEANASSTHT